MRSQTLYQISWGLWIIGMIPIVLSWNGTVSSEIGWAGFAIATVGWVLGHVSSMRGGETTPEQDFSDDAPAYDEPKSTTSIGR